MEKRLKFTIVFFVAIAMVFLLAGGPQLGIDPFGVAIFAAIAAVFALLFRTIKGVGEH